MSFIGYYKTVAEMILITISASPKCRELWPGLNCVLFYNSVILYNSFIVVRKTPESNMYGNINYVYQKCSMNEPDC